MNSPAKERIYQIYPSTFKDANGDGIGDLRGIIDRLDYIKDQNYDAIWLNPIYLSPAGTAGDGGYAITDHGKIDPKFGTDEDMDELIAKAHAKGLRVYMDFVPCHTSSDHEEFKKSCAVKNPSNDLKELAKEMYVWHPGKKDDQGNPIPPNNWRSVFGGRAWEYHDGRKQWYLHHFHTSQPALNLNNPEVQDYQLALMKKWFDRGVDGLRVDAIPFANFDPQFRDNPIIPDRQDYPDYGVAAWLRQRFVHSTHQEQTKEFVAKIRALADSYGPQASKKILGEVVAGRDGSNGSMDYAMELMDPQTGFHSCYTQSFVDLAWYKYPRAENVRNMIRHLINIDPTGKMGHAKDNHDFPRFASRMTEGTPYNLRDRVLKQIITLWMCLPGDKFEYNGSEQGLTQATKEDIPAQKIVDPAEEKREYCRTPPPHDDTQKNGEFSESDDPVLPIAQAHMARSVRLQRQQRDSILNFNKRVNEQWAENPALRDGETVLLETKNPIVAFVRKTKGQAVLCAVNMSEKNVHFTPSECTGMTPELLHMLNMSADDEIHMGAYGNSVVGLAPTRETAEEIGMNPSDEPHLKRNGVLKGIYKGHARTIFAADMLFADDHINAAEAPDTVAKIIAEHPEVADGGKLTIDEHTHFALVAEANINGATPPMTFGGSTGVTLWTLRKLLPKNTIVNMLSAVNDSIYGRKIKEHLDDADINRIGSDWPPHDHGEIHSEAVDSAATHIIHLPSGKTIIASYPGRQVEAIQRKLDQNPRLLEESVANSDIVYLPGSTVGKLGLTFAQKLLEHRWMHRKELVVALPTQAEFGPNDPDFYKYLLPSVNVALGEDREFCRIFGIATVRPVSDEHIQTVVEKIQEGFRQNVLQHAPGLHVSSHGQVAFITRAGKPALLVTRDRVIAVDPIEGITIRNRLGNDHTANAAFLYGYIKGYDHERSARMAMEMAAQKMEQEGVEPYLRAPDLLLPPGDSLIRASTNGQGRQ